MKLYDYNYEEMMDLTLSCDQRAPVEITSKVYPTKLEIKTDEEVNQPYLYYEGIVQTNKGAMKITFPKLNLILDCVQTKVILEDYFGYSTPKITRTKMTTEFINDINESSVMFEIKMLDSEDCKDIKEYFDNKYNK